MANGMDPKTPMRYWRWPIVVCAFIVIVIYIWCCWWPAKITTVYLVRHAEKGTGTNPSLTPTGQQRVQALQTLLRSADLEAIYCTEYCRTAQTAQPTAIGHNLDLHVMTVSSSQANFANCTPAIQVQTQIVNASSNHADTVASHLLANFEGNDVLVVGHSNTITEIIEALGAVSPCPDLAPLNGNGECHIPGSQYDNLFVVTVFGNAKARANRLRYGMMTP